MAFVNGQIVEERGPTAIGSTGGIPAGTLVTVPVAPAVGKTPNAPVVAVNAIPAHKSEILKICAGLVAFEAALEAADAFMTLPAWRKYVHPVIIIAAAARIAYLRYSTNSVINTAPKT